MGAFKPFNVNFVLHIEIRRLVILYIVSASSEGLTSTSADWSDHANQGMEFILQDLEVK